MLLGIRQIPNVVPLLYMPERQPFFLAKAVKYNLLSPFIAGETKW